MKLKVPNFVTWKREQCEGNEYWQRYGCVSMVYICLKSSWICVIVHNWSSPYSFSLSHCSSWTKDDTWRPTLEACRSSAVSVKMVVFELNLPVLLFQFLQKICYPVVYKIPTMQLPYCGCYFLYKLCELKLRLQLLLLFSQDANLESLRLEPFKDWLN